MVTLMMRSNPFFADYAEDAPVEETREARALPRTAPATVGVVVTGDNHLSPALPGLSPQRRAERRKRLRRAFAAAVHYAIAHRAGLFVLTGDLFDSPTPSARDRAFVAAALARLGHAGIPCVAISGEHDQPRGEQDAESPLAAFAAREALHYFGETDVLRPRLFTVGGLKVAVAGLSRAASTPPGYDPLASATVQDEENALARADVGLLLLHAPIEGLAPPEEREYAIRRGNLAALPAEFRVVAAGHIHHYRHKRLGERDIVLGGATERMSFDGDEGAAGFAWLELGRRGLVRATHVPIEEQPRADVVIQAARLWPEEMAPRAWDAADGEDTVARGPTPAPLGFSSSFNPSLLLRLRLSEVCTDEAMVRLRLCGALTREQRQELALGDLVAYLRRHAFSFELDTRGLFLRGDEGTPPGEARDAQ